LGEYGIKAERSEGLTGVWLDEKKPILARKICAMGVKCSRWVTMHGIGFNVNTNLEYFNYIVPCGITDKKVTSIEKELGYPVDMNEVKAKLIINLANIFDFNCVNSQGEVISHV
jgi:lipoyl(octanoyl) transferase